MALQQQLGAGAHVTESLAALQGLPQLFGQALQNEFWARLNGSMPEEQLARWAARCKRADLAEASQQLSQRNADVAALPRPVSEVVVPVTTETKDCIKLN